MIAFIKNWRANRAAAHAAKLDRHRRLHKAKDQAFLNQSDLLVSLCEIQCQTVRSLASLWSSSQHMAVMNAKLGQISDEWTADEIKTQLERALKEFAKAGDAQRAALLESLLPMKASLKEMKAATEALREII